MATSAIVRANDNLEERFLDHACSSATVWLCYRFEVQSSYGSLNLNLFPTRLKHEKTPQDIKQRFTFSSYRDY